jgi:hypothetical protein
MIQSVKNLCGRAVVFAWLLFASLLFASLSIAQTSTVTQEAAQNPAVTPTPVNQQLAQSEVAELLEWIGVLPAVRQVPQVAEMSMRGQLMAVAQSEALQEVQDSLQQQYAATDALQSDVVAFVAARVDQRTLSRAKNLLQQSVPVAVRKSSNLMQESSAVADMNEFHRRLNMQPAVGTRKDLLAEVDRVMRISLIIVQIQTAVDQAVNRRLATENFIQPAAENLLPQKRATREQFARQRVTDLLLFVYKDIRASELREYAILMSDDSIQKLLDLSQQAIELVLRDSQN